MARLQGCRLCLGSGHREQCQISVLILTIPLQVSLLKPLVTVRARTLLVSSWAKLLQACA